MIGEGGGGAILVAFGMDKLVTSGAVEELNAIAMERRETVGAVIRKGSNGIINSIR